MKSSAILLIVASILFWLSWFLMPDQGTADPVHILKIVAMNRTSVFNSVISGILSSVFYLIALFQIQARLKVLSTISIMGTTLLAIGVMGMCVDSFFHLFAYFLTSPTLDQTTNLTQVMADLQQTGVYFLIPILLPFFIGTIIWSWGLYRQQIIQKHVFQLGIFALIFGIAGGLLSKNTFPGARPTIVLLFLAFFAICHILIAIHLTRYNELRKQDF